MRTPPHVMEFAAFGLGFCLLSADVAGLLTSLRNPAIFAETKVAFPDDIVLTAGELRERIDQVHEDRRAYIRDLTRAVCLGVAHYWEDEGIDTYHLRVPLHENYLLFLASYLKPSVFRKFEFTDYRRAIERGVGLCSQHAVIEAEVLREKGIPSRMVGLSGHVVLQAEVDEKAHEWWVLDPNFGVAIPHSLSEIERDPAIIAPHFAEAGYDDGTIERLVGIFGRDGNVALEGMGSRPYHPAEWLIERAAYALIWLIPPVLMLPLAIRAARRRVSVIPVLVARLLGEVIPAPLDPWEKVRPDRWPASPAIREGGRR